MLYYLFNYLSEFDIPGARLMSYITFRSGVALMLSLFIATVIGRKIIDRLQLMQVGEIVRNLGLEGQMSKKGTPTMGGVIIIIAILIPCLLVGVLHNIYMILMIVATLWLGTLGFADDYIKVAHHDKDGLKGKFKIVGQVGLGLIVGLAALLLGFPPEEVLVKMSLLVPVAGRFQTFLSPRGYTAIVDYAHTPDALVNVLGSIREVIGTSGKIITVVGAGGNRDKGKRPIMAKEAALRSDRLILTSDNPRFENPEDILRDMAEGLDDEARRRTLKITDRKEAIRAAAQFAEKGDVVLIAGKGHEDYQEVCGVKHHFDDSEVVKEIFAEEK